MLRPAGTGAAGEPAAPQDSFLKIDFSDVLFSAYNATDPRPLESISFVFGSVEVQTFSQNPDGSAGDAITGGFNFQRRKAD